MKRKDLIRAIKRYAKVNSLDVVETEGANHTKFKVGNQATVVARHNEINEITAKAILKQIQQAQTEMEDDR